MNYQLCLSCHVKYIIPHDLPTACSSPPITCCINAIATYCIITIIITITTCCSVWNYVVDTENKFDFLYANTNEAQRRDVIYGTCSTIDAVIYLPFHFFHFFIIYCHYQNSL